jgi:WD40 repeat protein
MSCSPTRRRTHPSRVRLRTGAIVAYLTAVLAGAASAQDLVLDSAAREVHVLYVMLGGAPEARVRLFREVDGLETLVGERTIKESVGTRARVSFPVSTLTNCLYRVEVVEGQRRAIEALNLYDPAARTPAKQRRVSSLLAIPLELIGGFLEKYTSALMSPGVPSIWRIDVTSGAVERIVQSADGRIVDLAVAPDGTVAFSVSTTNRPSGELFIVPVGGKPTKLTDGSSLLWSGDGRLFFVREGKVFATSVPSGAPVGVGSTAGPVIDDLLGFPAGGGGRLLAASKLGSDSLALWLVDAKSGEAEAVSYDVAYLWLPALSPDRRRLVYSEYVGVGGRSRLILRTLPDASRPLTDGTWDDTLPKWSPDGKAVYFASDRP